MMIHPEKIVCVILFSLLLASCGDSGESGPGIDVRGTWLGTFVSDSGTRSLRVHIDSQSGRSLDGTWQNSDGIVIGYAGGYLPGEGRITLELWSEDEIGCDGLFGYYTKPYFKYTIDGVLDLSEEPISVTDSYATRSGGCSLYEHGDLTMTLEFPVLN